MSTSLNSNHNYYTYYTENVTISQIVILFLNQDGLTAKIDDVDGGIGSTV